MNDSRNAMSELPEELERSNSGRSLLRPIALVVVVVLSAIGVNHLKQRAATPWKYGGGIGSRFDRFQLEPLTGDARPVDRLALNDKVTMINFWGPWCGPCREEFPHLLQLTQDLAAHPDFQFLSVPSSGRTDSEASEIAQLAKETDEFLRERGAEFPTYCDRAALLRLDLMLKRGRDGFGYPTTVVLDRSSVIRGIWDGYRSGDEQQIRTLLKELLLP